MKKILTILFCIALLTISCEDKGVTSQRLTGDEPTLPAELKGLKVYRVSCGDNEYVKVGILNNQVVSTTYQSGKHQQSVILVNKGTPRTINVESVISENDSIIVIKKSK
jgi:hypothetical protein